MDPETCALIKRHVAQVDAHNRYLEKKRMWREYEEHQDITKREGRRQDGKEENAASAGGGAPEENEQGSLYPSKRRIERGFCRHGVLAGENPRHSDAFCGRQHQREPKDRERHGRVSCSLPSFDVHAAERTVTAREKQQRLLRKARTAEDGEPWLPDKYYVHELQHPHPWTNPTEVLSCYLASGQRFSDDDLTPKASTSAESLDDEKEECRSLEHRKRKRKKKSKEKRYTSAKKKKKAKKRKASV